MISAASTGRDALQRRASTSVCASIVAPFADRHRLQRPPGGAEPAANRTAACSRRRISACSKRPTATRGRSPTRSWTRWHRRRSTVADIGAGAGWFTMRLARRVGPNGIVYAEDVQRQMLEAIKRRVSARG